MENFTYKGINVKWSRCSSYYYIGINNNDEGKPDNNSTLFRNIGRTKYLAQQYIDKYITNETRQIGFIGNSIAKIKSLTKQLF